MIRIIAVGKKHEDWLNAGLQRYEKRLTGPFVITWDLVPHSSLEGEPARREESRRLLNKVSSNDHVVLLDETGTQMSSPELSSLFQDAFVHSKHVTLVIGGAYGVDETFKERANKVWSLSRLVFPHQLVRLILTEQLYRAQQIAVGSSYHHM